MEEDNAYEKLATPAEKKRWAKQNNLMYGGLIAVGVVVLQGFLTVSPLQVSGRISVVAFAIALPLLAVLVLLGELHSGQDAAQAGKLDEITKGVALISSLTGVVAAFWRIDWLAGVAVLVAGIVALSVYAARFSTPRFSQAVQRRRLQKKAHGK
jgi:type IV secretory pathway TrbD component